MTVENFLSFWNTHNTAIIEGLIALIIFLSLFLAYRSLFGKKGEGSADGPIDSAQIEKTLQKILENQNGQRKGKGGSAAAGEEGESLDMEFQLDEGNSAASGNTKAKSTGNETDEQGGSRESAAEVAQLRLTLTENQLKIEALQEKLEVAEKKAEEAVSAPAGDATAGGASAEALAENTKEREALKAKLKDLEARLAEYEIISEDIADLSRFKEENESLKKELAAKGGEAPAATPTPAAQAEEAPAPAAEVALPEEPVAEPVAEPAPAESVAAEDVNLDALAEELAAAAEGIAPVEEPTAAPAEEPVKAEEGAPKAEVAAQEAAPADEAAANDLIDDELMREFAAAVEGQKNASAAKAAQKAGDGSTPAKKTTAETDELMNEFENFVAKKS